MQGRLHIHIRVDGAAPQRLAEIGQRDHADQLLQLAAAQQEARMATAPRLVPQRAHGLVDVQPQDVATRHHDGLDAAVRQPQHRVDHLGLVLSNT